MQNSQRKKILFVITKSVWGGAQRYVFDLAVNVPRDQFETAIALGGNGPLKERLFAHSIPVYPIASFQKSINPFKDIGTFFELLSVYRHFNPDIIHTNSSKAGGIAGLAVLICNALFRKRIRCVFTVHGWAFLETWRPTWQRFFIRFFSIITTMLHDTVIVISECDRKAALSYNVAHGSKVTLIHNGISAVDFLARPEAQQKLIGNEFPLVIGAITEWTKNKGIKYLIEAMPSVLEQFPEAKLCLVGWGEEYTNFKFQISNFKLEKNVFLISKSPAAAYLKAFDIFVLPSLKEGLPYTILEAGLAGLPVVATRVGGIPDIIETGKSGILVDPASPDQLADPIIQLSRNKNLREHMGIELQKCVEQNFSLSHMLQKTIALYRSPR
ncbi:MAG: glycosyltransferase [Parcubacteria group bacterium Gr01-1014_29]|nr:MAG: glycosyltransferase [Parcubacteria group bacterium Gr01-1014_29]